MLNSLTLTSRSINKPSTYVLEMNGNSVSVHNISIGDTISFIEKKKFEIIVIEIINKSILLIKQERLII